MTVFTTSFLHEAVVVKNDRQIHLLGIFSFKNKLRFRTFKKFAKITFLRLEFIKNME